ncbi:hypothetical protein QI038_11205 [Staphylococcus saprophyticus]|nr:hypothetical protein [Staphylococcus saprophyticus]
MSYERTTKDSVEYIANKFAENPGHFAATILRMYWDVEKQRDQYKAERDTLNSKLNKSYEDNYKLEGQLHDMTKQHDTLIDDLAVLKANISRLEQIREIKDSALKGADIKIKTLKRENERLRVKSDSFFESWKFKSAMYTDLSKESDKYKSLLSEFSQHIGNKPSSSTYKYFREKLDDLNITEDE